MWGINPTATTGRGWPSACPLPTGLPGKGFSVPQSLAQVLVHLIFSTKNREPFLSDDIRPELHPYMATILKGMDSSAILINSVEDHAHVLFHLSKNHALCDVIESLKKDSSKWIKTKGRNYRNFHWQS